MNEFGPSDNQMVTHVVIYVTNPKQTNCGALFRAKKITESLLFVQISNNFNFF